MPTPQYTALATTTLGSTASSVTFSSISGSYRDLMLVLDGKSTATADLAFRVNGDNTNYYYVHMTGTGSTASSSSRTNGDYIIPSYGVIASISANQTNCIINFMDYTATDKHKTILLRTSDSTQATSAEAARWASTSAITNIACYALGTTFAVGSTFSLYGVK